MAGTITATRTGRAEPLPADERRAAIVAAAVPLLRLHGRGVTTRQIADAAGIAEGTIFRVFADKDTLIDATIAAVLDPGSTVAELDAIDRRLPLDARLVNATAVVQHRLSDIFAVMSAIGMRQPPKGFDRTRRGAQRPELAALVRLLDEDDAEAITVEPLAAAQLLWGLTLAASHPASVFDQPLAPADVVAVLLDGIRSPGTRLPLRRRRARSRSEIAC